MAGEPNIHFEVLVDQLRLQGDVFEPEGELQVTVPPGPRPLVTGAVANLSSTSTFEIGVGGLNDRLVRWSGGLGFVTPDALLDDCVSDDGVLCTAAASFQFNGLLHAFDFYPDAHLADFELTGKGRASGLFDSHALPPFRITYTFQSGTVPEPSALLLVGSVIVGGAVRRRLCVRPHAPG
jgi:hypothetical protein